MLYVQTADKAITVLRIRTAEEMAAKKLRRKKREREKAKAKGGEDVDNVEEEDDEVVESGNEWIARITGWCVVRASGKIRSFSLVDSEDPSSSKGVQVGVMRHYFYHLFRLPIPTPSDPPGTLQQLPRDTHCPNSASPWNIHLEIQGEKREWSNRARSDSRLGHARSSRGCSLS